MSKAFLGTILAARWVPFNHVGKVQGDHLRAFVKERARIKLAEYGLAQTCEDYKNIRMHDKSSSLGMQFWTLGLSYAFAPDGMGYEHFFTNLP